MKDKIMFLIIGILIGAIITTAGFLIYNTKIKSDTPQMNNNGQMGDMQGQQGSGNMQEPPAKPDGDNSTTPPAKPGENNNATATTNNG